MSKRRHNSEVTAAVAITGPKLTGFKLDKPPLGSTALKHNGEIRGIAVSSDGKYFASSGDSEGLHLWNPKTGESIGSVKSKERGSYSLCLSHDGAFALVGGMKLEIFDIAKQKLAGELPVKTPLIAALAVSKNGVVLSGDNKTPRRFDLKTRKEILPVMKGHLSRIDACAINDDASLALTGGGDKKIKLHALTAATAGKKTQVKIIATVVGYSKSCGFAPDGKTAWSVGWDHALLFDIDPASKTFGEVTWKPSEERFSMRRGALSPDGKLLAIATEEEVVIYNLALPGAKSKKAYKRLPMRQADVIAFDVTSKLLLGGGDGRGLGEGCGIEVFDIEAERRVLPSTDAGHTGGITSIAIPKKQPNTLVSLGVDRNIVLWDLDSGAAVETLGPLSDEGAAVDVTDDGKTIVATASDGQSTLWDVSSTSSKVLPTVIEHHRGSVAIRFSPDNSKIGWAPYTPGMAVVYDTALALKGKYDSSPVPYLNAKERKKAPPRKAKKGFVLPQILKGHNAQMCAIDFSPDSTVLYTSSANERAIAWALSTGERLYEVSCDGFVEAVAAVGNSLVAAANYSLSVFNAKTGKEDFVIRSAEGRVQRVIALGTTHIAIVRDQEGGGDTSVVEVWSIDGSKNEKKRKKPEASADFGPLMDSVPAIAASPDGKRIYVGTNKGMIWTLTRT